jgi:hypothetical protein
MPWVIGLVITAVSGALAVKTVGDEAEDLATKTGPNLMILAAAGLGLFAAYKVISKR